MRLFHPSSRHLDCPSCRSRDRCSCGHSKQRKSATCRACRPTEQRSNGNWKGGKTRHKAGYVMISAPGHPRARSSNYVFEHILVMKVALGRHLLPDETVHHVNGVRYDNRIDNLELWVRPQPTDIRVEDAVTWANRYLRSTGEHRVVTSNSAQRLSERSWRWRESNPRA